MMQSALEGSGGLYKEEEKQRALSYDYSMTNRIVDEIPSACCSF